MDQLLFLLVLASFYVELPGADAHNHEIEMYWQSVLPNAVMPKPLKALIPHGLVPGEGVVPNYNSTKSPGPSYVYSAKSSSQWNGFINADNRTLFFLEKDLHKGMKMNLIFVSDSEATFLPRQVADSIPFTSNKLPQILKELSIKPGSEQAKLLDTTLELCEEPSIKGEYKYCATSLESMIDFSVSRVGKNAKVLATELNGKGNDQTQSYDLVKVKKARDKSVGCHKMTYAYAVYLCHETLATKSYVVSLVGANRSKVKALAMCHFDTSAWDPNFPAFKILKVKPGTFPICHFLPKDTVVWVPN